MKKMVALAFLFQAAVSLFSYDWEKDCIVVTNFRPIAHSGYNLTLSEENTGLTVEEEHIKKEEERILRYLKNNNFTNISPSPLQRKAAESAFMSYYTSVGSIINRERLTKAFLELYFPDEFKSSFFLEKRLFVIILWESPEYKAIFFEQ